jgi:hypothetical protein
MKKIILSLCLLGCIVAQAQTFTIAGKIVEAKDTQRIPVNFADVYLSVKDSVVKFDVTRSDGSFTLHAPQGSYGFLVKQLGDTLYFQHLDLNGNVDMGVLQIKTSGELQTVNITAQKPLIERKVDRLVFNVENSVAATGGDALDALKVTPGVQVQNDQISMIGKSGLAVMINDRILNLSGDDLINYLKSIKSDDIQSIEVITTPPAKYDAEGNSGIINIKLKKAAPNSWSATLFGSYTQFKYANINEGASFRYNKNKLSFYANVSHNNGVAGYKTSNNIIHYPDTLYNSTTNGKSNFGKNISANAGVDYDFSKKLSMGAQYIYTHNETMVSAPNNTYLYSPYNTPSSLIQTLSNDTSKTNGNNFNFHTLYQLDTLGRKIELNFDYFDYNTDIDNIFNTNEYADFIDLVAGSYDAANNGSTQGITNYSVKIDVTHPLKWLDLSYGGKLSFTKNNSSIYYYDLTTGVPVFQQDRSDNYTYNENLQALYASANKKMGKWQVQVGLRMEKTEAKGISPTLAETYRYNYLKLFPTAYLLYKLNNKNSFSINYSERVNRPAFYAMDPFISYVNPYSTTQGNPFLQPAYTHNLELDYTYGNNWNSSLYFSRSLSMQTQVQYISTGNINTAVKWENGYNETDLGLSESYTFKKWKWLESVNTGVLSYYKITSLIPQYTPGSGITAELETENNFVLNEAKTFSLSVDYWYAFPQYFRGVFKMHHLSDLSLGAKALFLKKKLTAAIYSDDVLRIMNIHLSTNFSGIQSFMNMYEYRQSVRLSLSYTFGNSHISGKRVNSGNAEERQRAGN